MGIFESEMQGVWSSGVLWLYVVPELFVSTLYPCREEKALESLSKV